MLLAQWLVGERDIFGAPTVRLGQIAAWLVGSLLYQWLSPVGPAWWARIVDHSHPGKGAIGGSLPSFAAAFALSLGLTLVARAADRRHRPSLA